MPWAPVPAPTPAMAPQYAYGQGGSGSSGGGGASPGPAFRAWQSSSQSIPGSTFTKVNFQTAAFDTDSVYDTSTSRFQPGIAGYYDFDAAVGFASVLASNSVIALYKNGAIDTSGDQPNGGTFRLIASGLIYLDVTDYVEVYAFLSAGASAQARIDSTFFTGHLARPA